MPQRSIKIYTVTERLPKPEMAFASLSYLRLRYLRDAGVEDLGAHLPYGANPEAKYLFYTVHANPPGLFASPFLYQAQYRDVQQVVAIPFERLGDIDQPARSHVTFVFSIGRCGSTLLAKILTAADLTAISEPDIFTQMARREARQFSLPEKRECIAASTRCLSSYARDRAVIKLRNHCNNIALTIAGAVANTRCEFVLRNRRDWARSMMAAFGTDARVLARQLGNAVMTLDRLIETGKCTGPIWYEDLIHRPADVLRRFSEELPAGLDVRLNRAMAQDSQAATRLARKNLSHRIVPEPLLDRFEDHWRELRPELLLKKYDLEDRL